MDDEHKTEPEPAPANPVWMRHLDGIADELVRLTAICEVDLRTPGAVDRVLRDDPTVCGKKNPIAFKKLRSLLVATYDSLNKAVDRIGAGDVKAITSAIIARIDRHRAAGGQKPGQSGNPFGQP